DREQIDVGARERVELDARGEVDDVAAGHLPVYLPSAHRVVDAIDALAAPYGPADGLDVPRRDREVFGVETRATQDVDEKRQLIQRLDGGADGISGPGPLTVHGVELEPQVHVQIATAERPRGDERRRDREVAQTLEVVRVAARHAEREGGCEQDDVRVVVEAILRSQQDVADTESLVVESAEH